MISGLKVNQDKPSEVPRKQVEIFCLARERFSGNDHMQIFCEGGQGANIRLEKETRLESTCYDFIHFLP